VALEAKALGVKVIDVRLRRADLPDETSQAIFDRMKSEREREAKEIRAQGQERAVQIKSRADREKTVLLAESQKMAQIAKGQGDGEANTILSSAYSQDPQFFALYRSLQSYRASLEGKNTTMVLSPDSEFFRYFNQSNGGRR
jgi:membrane protease subunit HflC